MASLVSQNFLTEANLTNVLRQVVVVSLLACGVTFVIILGQIDVSLGSVMALTGTIAASVMVGAAEQVSSVPWFWSDQYEMTLQVTGLAEGVTNSVRRNLGESAFILFHLAANGRLLAASGIGVGSAVARDIRLAEMLISRAAHPDPASLAASSMKLKSLL